MNKFHEMLKIANIHAARIELALAELKTIFPIDQHKVRFMSTQELLLIDLLVNRFAKLQDFLGQKIINEFLLLGGEIIDNLTMLDKINKLERLGVIASAELWKEMCEARNHVSHEYPDAPELTARYLNQIFALAPKLLSFLAEIRKRAEASLAS